MENNKNIKHHTDRPYAHLTHCTGCRTKECLNTGMHLVRSAYARNLFTTIIMLGYCYQYIITIIIII
jgi:hypothetical protein